MHTVSSKPLPPAAVAAAAAAAAAFLPPWEAAAAVAAAAAEAEAEADPVLAPRAMTVALYATLFIRLISPKKSPGCIVRTHPLPCIITSARPCMMMWN
jgi:hypothetical protein